MSRDFVFSQEELMRYNDIIISLYQRSPSLDHQEHVKKVFFELRKLVPYYKADLLFFRTGKNDNLEVLQFIPVNWESEEILSYTECYSALDDVLPVLMTVTPVMFKSTDFFTTDIRRKSRYYNEMIIPSDIQYSIEGNIICNNHSGLFGEIGVFRSSNEEDFTEKELFIMKLLQPHLSNLVYFLDFPKENKSKGQYDSSLKYIDVFNKVGNIGICVLNASMEIVYLNIELRLMMQKNRSVFKSDDIAQTFKSMCMELKNKEALDIAERSFPNEGKEGRYYIKAVRFNHNMNNNSSYVIMVDDIAKKLDRKLLYIQEKYNLSKREIEVLRCIASGKSNSEISNELAISLSVTKKHISNLLTKTKTKSRVQLLNMLK